MPLVLERNQVLEVYREAASRKWVLPTFNSENLTSTEAILTAASDYAEKIGIEDLPIIVGITNKYKLRPQSSFYTPHILSLHSSNRIHSLFQTQSNSHHLLFELLQ